jgi:hypothetical protein
VAIFHLRVVLTNGEQRDVNLGEVADLSDMLRKFERGDPPFNETWIDTTDASPIRREDIVEYSAVPIN